MLTHTLIDHLWGNKTAFLTLTTSSEYLALGNYTQAAKTAVIIARQEQELEARDVPTTCSSPASGSRASKRSGVAAQLRIGEKTCQTIIRICPSSLRTPLIFSSLRSSSVSVQVCVRTVMTLLQLSCVHLNTADRWTDIRRKIEAIRIRNSHPILEHHAVLLARTS
ncbi:hypothetical protein GN958_ATG07249 [Phytophthora infestans]|uniref:Uncharacterized protein n=1 Tax=Phytophthora infestans TaxID=4787 RepID=A0A8S9URF5_PHYIN|nr:hypothetical protein GN958_ATG07249 [Phytophthora infestans]